MRQPRLSQASIDGVYRVIQGEKLMMWGKSGYVGANEILMLGYVYIVAKGETARNIVTLG